MSASLVGSEMCIRDRTTTTGANWSCRTPRSRRTACGGRGGTPRAPWRPVSYTHLTLPTICSV
eukprot:13823344-Alexandrium_andersonii.AAC.1